MDWLSLLGVAIGILKGVLAASTKAKLPQEVLTSLASAITQLESVHSTPVTKAQLEQLRIDGPFGG